MRKGTVTVLRRPSIDGANLVLKCPDWNTVEAKYGKENVLGVFCRTLIGDRNDRIMKPMPEEDVDNRTEHDNTSDELMTDDESGEANHDGEKEQLKNKSDDQSSIADARLFSPMDILGMKAEEYRLRLIVSHGRRLAILDSGHIGIVQAHARLGDEVIVALGCTMPLVVRRDGETDYGCVGESYVYGVMDGEMMDGERESLTMR
ncbi:hypothetical protein EJ04DRAFT_82225 [Polyplosphaeria fusca]|uniref:Uncharacterized protein n=1 Tax=Polyplosphaeria fusca TaxID=682080 RepID=A0A9P4QMH3_9PLEO|nr:hypothetical protein EJ04DRAFT_82225 [Polyplosphaeria fusca]